jgi:ubiquinone/menaquinone biosynthesis C-methylase UbiE
MEIENTLGLFIGFSITLLFIDRILLPRNKCSEGFTQTSPFVHKTDQEIYDDFYCEIYDELHETKGRIPFEIDFLLKNTKMNNKSKVLDIGSGTGGLVYQLEENKIACCGIDNSHSMVKKSLKTYPNIQIIEGNALDSMHFDKGTFTHV